MEQDDAQAIAAASQLNGLVDGILRIDAAIQALKDSRIRRRVLVALIREAAPRVRGGRDKPSEASIEAVLKGMEELKTWVMEPKR